MISKSEAAAALGSIKSEKKAAAARANGAKSTGRPRNKWTVSHYYQNPRNNRTVTCDTKQEALEHFYGISSDETPCGCSYLEKNGVAIARRDWNKRRATRL